MEDRAGRIPPGDIPQPEFAGGDPRQEPEDTAPVRLGKELGFCSRPTGSDQVTQYVSGQVIDYWQPS